MAMELRPIDRASSDQLWEMIYDNPIRHCFVASKLEQHGDGTRNSLPNVVGAFNGTHLESALLFGANLVPINPTQESLDMFAQALVQQGRRCSSIVGSAFDVMELWNRIKGEWGNARELRTNQPVLATATRSELTVDELVRYSSLSDLDVLFPACVEMFTQEVGLSPVTVDGGTSYRNRISELIASRRSFVRVDDDNVVFKTEVGCLGAAVAQLQGVWVAPNHRGQGVGQHALASVIKFVLEDLAPIVSLYVNDYNKAALAMYEKVGFKQVDSFATVLF